VQHKEGHTQGNDQEGAADSNGNIGSRVVNRPTREGAEQAYGEKQEKLLLRTPVEKEPIIENLRERLSVDEDARINGLMIPERKRDTMLIEARKVGADQDDLAL